MNINVVKTKKFVPGKSSIDDLLREIPKLKDKSIVAISSKVLSICEGNIVDRSTIDHDLLVSKLADTSLEPVRRSKNGMILTQVGNVLVESAGVDESNADGYYILLPKDPYKSSKNIWSELRKRDGIKHLGVIVTDSHSVPRRKGAIGFAIASYGFKAVKEYLHEKDIFGRKFKFTASDVSDSLAAVSTLEMGEGKEGTPITIITDTGNIEFFNKTISLRAVKKYSWIHPDLDVYAPLLKSSLWKK